MSELMDCMVNYFSFDAKSDGSPRRYYCYLVVAGGGPTPDAGVASITTLAVHEGDTPCNYCVNYFFAPSGGPEAALEKALHYLDAHHEGSLVHKVVSRRRAPGDFRTQENRGPRFAEASGLQ